MKTIPEQRFHIIGGGDSDTGIPPSDMIVTFNGNRWWDDDLINHTKELLGEWDDNGAEILTDKEYKEMLKNDEEMGDGDDQR